MVPPPQWGLQPGSTQLSTQLEIGQESTGTWDKTQLPLAGGPGVTLAD